MSTPSSGSNSKTMISKIRSAPFNLQPRRPLLRKVSHQLSGLSESAPLKGRPRMKMKSKRKRETGETSLKKRPKGYSTRTFTRKYSKRPKKSKPSETSTAESNFRWASSQSKSASTKSPAGRSLRWNRPP